jgi:hypothetical protein
MKYQECPKCGRRYYVYHYCEGLKKMNEIERKHELETRLEMYLRQKERIEQKESLS